MRVLSTSELRAVSGGDFSIGQDDPPGGLPETYRDRFVRQFSEEVDRVYVYGMRDSSGGTVHWGADDLARQDVEDLLRDWGYGNELAGMTYDELVYLVSQDSQQHDYTAGVSAKLSGIGFDITVDTQGQLVASITLVSGSYGVQDLADAGDFLKKLADVGFFGSIGTSNPDPITVTVNGNLFGGGFSGSVGFNNQNFDATLGLIGSQLQMGLEVQISVNLTSIGNIVATAASNELNQAAAQLAASAQQDMGIPPFWDPGAFSHYIWWKLTNRY